jgi:6-phosphogluconolactonase
LFPGTAALAERERWAAAMLRDGAKLRITLTYPVRESYRSADILVMGKKSAPCSPASPGRRQPTARFNPAGTLYLFADAAAAGEAMA